ncbi:MAG: bifunctional diaminohydroxyphosphoribosylaminopyrimidine deaminase/5-amino-6-(5-phosphoribosylamino)uracil reductase RibD [Gemmatimonadota bacterium]
MAAADDRRFMRRALELAAAGWGRVHPNPMVGAVVVRDGVVVGEGYHTAFGAPHAEVEALRAAGGRARGATVYVTLEPCAHHGKTPPCTEALAKAGVARVVFAAEDPGAEAGGGGAWLRAAGVEVTAGVERAAARRQNAAFFHALERPGCYVALKYGMSLDGRLSRRGGERMTVTGPESHAEVHRLRAGFDAIMVGGETARVDDPLLTVRGGVTPIRPPARVVLDPGATLDPGSRLVRTARDAPVIVVMAAAGQQAARRRGALEDAGVHVLETGSGEGGLDLAGTLERLRAEGIQSVLCEGGGRLGSALLAAGLVQRLYLFMAPELYGGGVPAFPSVGRRITGVTVDVQRYGDDVLLVVDLDEPEPDGGTAEVEAAAGIG